MIWRPVIAGHASIADVNDGRVSLGDLLKLNALMDAQYAAEEKAAKKPKP